MSYAQIVKCFDLEMSFPIHIDLAHFSFHPMMSMASILISWGILRLSTSIQPPFSWVIMWILGSKAWKPNWFGLRIFLLIYSS
jgi:hypothetical protein